MRTQAGFVSLKREGVRKQRKGKEQHAVRFPDQLMGKETLKSAAKLPENAARTHRGSRVITKSFCPRLSTVISLKAWPLTL